jgi:uncharacterized DUF497 family protein
MLRRQGGEGSAAIVACIYNCVGYLDENGLGGFDWDRGNVSKCQKHGVSVAEIESLFGSGLLVLPDSAHSKAEPRQGHRQAEAGRWVFLVFTIRVRAADRMIRPISARYMHAKEVAAYEKENPDL